MKRTNINLILLKIPMDILMLSAAYTTAFKLRTSEFFFETKPEFMFFLLKASLLYIAINFLLNSYSLTNKKQHDNTMLSMLIWFGLTVCYYFFRQKLFFSRLILTGGVVLAFVYVKFGRILLRVAHYQLRKRGYGKTNLLIVGMDNKFKTTISTLQKDINYNLLGYIGPDQNEELAIKRLSEIDNYKKICKEYDIEEIIQVSENLSQGEEILEFCLQNRIQYRFIPSISRLHKSNIDVEVIKDIPIISLKPTPLDGWGRVLKRITDVFGAIVGLIITLPITIPVSIVIKLTSKGPILVKLQRINQGKSFGIYKFRSMVDNAHALKDDLIKQGMNERKGKGPLFKMENDPRVTKIGQFIRNTRIDEIAQFINVLRGDMSLVGPRPHEVKEVEQYEDHHLKTLSIKPGMTGLSQISGNSSLSFEDEVRLDMLYIEKWSLIWDFKLMIKTIIYVLSDWNNNV